ncbi:hypothetical protein AMATHDRAFT_67487 [Amanita thiersii Skay4041]|uniref:Ribosome biogenesis protein NOP53 n=1 Tax=Amanita thiersii Skay4041 TaxID=703135 RepID=A0A2A9NIS5_9AGAR|nr:hypothetical protein AMATHDRAFT_67487 [Amanita thiersii Skay4041]
MTVQGGTKSVKKSATSSLGAPSQYKQASRKGKKSWRKNVDIEDVEEALEGLRTEERETGTTLQKKQDEELFVIDVKGDDRIRHTLPKYSSSQLTSLKVLSQRSAIPAVFSRTTASSTKKRALTHEEKERLIRIAKRPRKGPFNSVLDPSEYKSGSTIVELSEAVKQSGRYDPWAAKQPVTLPDGLENVYKPKIKMPKAPHPKEHINVPAVLEPHQGTSYNPPVDAHQELLLQAHKTEEKRVQEVERLALFKKKIDGLRQEVNVEDEAVAPGMKVQEPDSDEEHREGKEEEDEAIIVPPRKMPERKTKQQRQKALQHLTEQRTLAERAAKKRLLASIGDATSLRKATKRLMKTREEERYQRRLAMKERVRRRGLAGQKLGKHKIPEGEVDVQLGEDLSESLRALKPEGNLFHDRFLSMQQRALIEPRIRVIPKRHRTKIVEYEKHAWKRFE